MGVTSVKNQSGNAGASDADAGPSQEAKDVFWSYIRRDAEKAGRSELSAEQTKDQLATVQNHAGSLNDPDVARAQQAVTDAKNTAREDQETLARDFADSPFTGDQITGDQIKRYFFYAPQPTRHAVNEALGQAAKEKPALNHETPERLEEIEAAAYDVAKAQNALNNGIGDPKTLIPTRAAANEHLNYAVATSVASDKEIQDRFTNTPYSVQNAANDALAFRRKHDQE